MSDVWRITPERGNKEHPAPFPVELAERCIGSTSARVVLDPFCGSGTTCVAAKRLGRSWIGIDKSERYCEGARARLGRTRAQLSLFGESVLKRNGGGD